MELTKVSCLLSLMVCVLLSSSVVKGGDLLSPDGVVETSPLVSEEQHLQNLLDEAIRAREELQRNVSKLQTMISNLTSSVQAANSSVDNLPTLPPTTVAPITTTLFDSLPEIAEVAEAELTSDQSGQLGDSVKFDNVVSNSDFAYDPTTGTFRCLQKGLYLFSLTAYIQSSYAFPVSLYLNNMVIARPYTGESNVTVASSETAVAKARQGDEVRVMFTSPTKPTTIMAHARFSAVLIQKL